MNTNNIKKSELHLHLDGSLRPETILELGLNDKIDLPSSNLKEIRKHLSVGKENNSLVDYLKKFDLPLQIMQSKKNIERVSYELLEDLAKENYIYAEIRFAPHLHQLKGLSLDEVVESVIKGFSRAKSKYKIKFGIILCIMRHLDINLGYDIIKLSQKYKDNNVVGVDLAGDEYNHSVEKFSDIFIKLKENKIKYTIHAGEAIGYKSIEKALDLGAKRIGHGIRCIENLDLINRIKEDKIILEICPISNYQTKVFDNFDKYPIKELINYGVNLSLNTDNRTVSNTNLIKEINFIKKRFAINEASIIKMLMTNIEGAFCSLELKYKLLFEFNKSIK